MVKFVRFLVSVACIGMVATGCGMPAPPWQVNAVVTKNLPIYSEDATACSRADAVVLAQCIENQEYAKTVKGDWERHWYATRWRVVCVERGRWSDDTIDFVYHYIWPTPESGILVDTPLPLYYKGNLMAFCVDNSQGKPVILAQEQRSRVPPHGKLRWPAAEFSRPGSQGAYDEVMAAATRFGETSQSRLLPRQVVEEYDDFYVVEMGDLRGTEVVTVKKGTHQVQPVEPASK